MTCTCPDCGATYSGKRGGHCRGGKYGGCCRTFASDGAAAKHRVGPYNDRRCVDVEDDWRTGKDGMPHKVPWRLTERGWTDSRPLDNDYWKDPR